MTKINQSKFIRLKVADFSTARSVLNRFTNLHDATLSFTKRMVSYKYYKERWICFSVIYKDKDYTVANNITSEPIFFDFRTKKEWSFGNFMTFALYPRRVAPFFCQYEANKLVPIDIPGLETPPKQSRTTHPCGGWL